MTDRENWLRAIEFRSPERIPCSVSLSPATWREHREALEELVLAHRLLFPDHESGSVDYDYNPPGYEGTFRDNWGCLWYAVPDGTGMEGQVIESPLADWRALDSYRTPDVETKTERGERDWNEVAERLRLAEQKGLPRRGSGERLFDRLYLLRGFENLMIDIATEDERLPRLIDLLVDHELALVRKWLDIGVDAIGFHTDIGTQKALMISPRQFRKYIKPMFKEIFSVCREAGAHVLLSSDGRLLEIVDDLINCGVSRHDPQLRANTLAGIEAAYKGELCIELDLDRQMFPFCTPQDIRRQIEDVIARLGSPEGGLMISGSISGPNVPLQNIEALCSALEELCW